MQVRMKVGRNAGEVHEVPYHIAAQLIADGRAERPNAPVVVEEPAVATVTPVHQKPRTAAKAAKKRR